MIILWLSLLACGESQNHSDTVIVESGVEIPIQACVDAHSVILGDAVDAINFCKCLIPKVFTDLKGDPEKLKLLQEDKWYDVSIEANDLIASYYLECVSFAAGDDSTARITFTPRMLIDMKNKIKQELAGTEIEETNDVDRYCDCILNSMQTDFTIKEIVEENSKNLEKLDRMLAECLESTRKD